MTQYVHYVGHAEHFTSKQKTERMNEICNEMAAEGFQMISVIPDIGGDGTTIGLWLFFTSSRSDQRGESTPRERVLAGA